jgi:hypothetical protein
MVIFRLADPEDTTAIRQLCERELDLEPDAAELPGTLTRRAGYLGLVAEADGEVAGVCFGSLGRATAAGRRSYPRSVRLVRVQLVVGRDRPLPDLRGARLDRGPLDLLALPPGPGAADRLGDELRGPRRPLQAQSANTAPESSSTRRPGYELSNNPGCFGGMRPR